MKKLILFCGVIIALFTFVFTNLSANTPDNQLQWSEDSYTIAYELNGGIWSSANKEGMKRDFLTDLYNYYGPTENLMTFMHGVGNTSGYDGTWTSYLNGSLYQINDKESNATKPYFINQPQYNGKWVPFFDLLDVLVQETNPAQSFWGSTYVGLIRIKEYFTGARYADDERLPGNLPGLMDYQKSYSSATLPLILPIPTRVGYNFVNWFDNAEFSGTPVSMIDNGVSGNKLYYAKWESIEYNLTYQLNGGSLDFVNRNDLKDAFLLDFYNFIEPVEDLNTFKHGIGKSSGYDGTWHSTYKDKLFAENKKEIDRYSDTFINQVEYNERWMPFYNLLDQFITEINASQSLWNDLWAGQVRFRQYFIDDALFAAKTTLPSCPAHTKYIPESNNFTLVTPKKAGITFLGWYSNSSFTGSRVYDIATGTTGNKTFYAKWGYTVAYVLNGGTNHSANPSSYTVGQLPITLNAPTKAGYTFAGWYNNAAFTGSAITTIAAGTTGNITLYAKYVPTSYSISYVLNGGTNGSNPATYSIETLPVNFSNPTRSGYTFAGWYDNAAFTGNQITTLGVGSSGNKTLYAKWTPVTYTISYVLNGGINDNTNPTSYTVLELPLELNVATKSGYLFAGWYDNAAFNGTALTILTAGTTGNKTFYAKFVSTSTFNLTYVLNGGTNNAGNPATYSGADLPLTLLAPTKNGYNFVGWYDNVAFTGTAITSLAVGTTGNISLYAKWQAKEYSIGYVLNGGLWTFSSRNALKDAFLQDFYNYIQPTEDLTTFKHGVGKTSGYDGTWHSVYKSRLYAENYKGVDRDSLYFINQPEYNAKWLPFYNLLDTFITEINPAQSLWGDLFAGNIRFRQYFIDDALFSGKTTLPSCGGPLKYYIDSNIITLPTPTKASSVFLGWYSDANFTSTRVYSIAEGSTGNKTFYAKWSVPNVGNGYIDFAFSGNQAITIGTTVKLTPSWKKITMSDTFTYTSSNSTIATVDASGNVKGMKAGNVIIRATSVSTGLYAEVGITVYGTEVSDPLLKYLITQNSGKLFTQNVYYIGYNGSYWNRIYNTVNNYLATPDDTVNTSLWLTGGIKGSGEYMDPIYITIHDTGSATSSSTAYANGGWCVNPSNTGSSWHYTVGNDGVYQHISRYRQAWHAGDGDGPGNTQSIGIETAVNNGSDVWWTWQKTAKLSGRIMVEEGMNMNSLKFHRDWSGKVCPGTMINAGLTEEFRSLVQTEYTIRKNYPGYTISFQSHSPYINNAGKVISRPTQTTNVTYTITVTKAGVSQSVTLNCLIPGTNTW